jgi:hypothetical protein
MFETPRLTQKEISGLYTVPYLGLAFSYFRSVFGIATSYGLDDRGVGVRVPVGSRIVSPPDRPDRL